MPGNEQLQISPPPIIGATVPTSESIHPSIHSSGLSALVAILGRQGYFIKNEIGMKD